MEEDYVRGDYAAPGYLLSRFHYVMEHILISSEILFFSIFYIFFISFITFNLAFLHLTLVLMDASSFKKKWPIYYRVIVWFD